MEKDNNNDKDNKEQKSKLVAWFEKYLPTRNKDNKITEQTEVNNTTQQSNSKYENHQEIKKESDRVESISLDNRIRNLDNTGRPDRTRILSELFSIKNQLDKIRASNPVLAAALDKIIAEIELSIQNKPSQYADHLEKSAQDEMSIENVCNSKVWHAMMDLTNLAKQHVDSNPTLANELLTQSKALLNNIIDNVAEKHNLTEEEARSFKEHLHECAHNKLGMNDYNIDNPGDKERQFHAEIKDKAYAKKFGVDKEFDQLDTQDHRIISTLGRVAATIQTHDEISKDIDRNMEVESQKDKASKEKDEASKEEDENSIKKAALSEEKIEIESQTSVLNTQDTNSKLETLKNGDDDLFDNDPSQTEEIHEQHSEVESASKQNEQIVDTQYNISQATQSEISVIASQATEQAGEVVGDLKINANEENQKPKQEVNQNQDLSDQHLSSENEIIQDVAGGNSETSKKPQEISENLSEAEKPVKKFDINLFIKQSNEASPYTFFPTTSTKSNEERGI